MQTLPYKITAAIEATLFKYLLILSYFFQILWLLLSCCRLGVELSVIIFGVWAGMKCWH